jgi:acetyl-CoA synthetase
MLERYVSSLEFDSYESFYKNFSVLAPEGFNFAYDVLDELANTHGSDLGLLWCDENGAEASFTFGDLKRLSDKAGNVIKNAGLVKGDTVMLILKRRWEYWPILLALHKLGVIAIPTTHLLSTKDIMYRCKAADVAGIISVDDEDMITRVDEAEKTMKAESGFALKFKAFVRRKKDFTEKNGWKDFNVLLENASQILERPKEPITKEDIMLLYFTSGTAGMPKMVRHNFAYPLGHIVTANFWQRVKPGDLHLTVAETGWAKAAWGKIYGQWLCRAPIFVYDYDQFIPTAMLKILSKYKISTFCAPPTIYRFFVKEDLSKYDFSALRHCTVAGEPLNPEIYEQFKNATGLSLKEAYGQTELTIIMGNWDWFEPKPGSMGKPAPGYDIDIVHDDGSPCGVGEKGEIVVRTDKRMPAGMFDGYYRDDELTKNVWNNGIYYTGDVAWRDEDGYYWFVGRADDVIKSSGYRIGPFEVESALLEHPAVLECAVTGVPDPKRGTVVKATVVLAKNWKASEELKKELQIHVKTVSTPYKYPRIIEFVSELPKTISGKIRRVQIREEDGQKKA